MSAPTIHISRAELAIVRDILDRCLPPGFAAYAFGSRATGRRLKPWSDLDLAIEGPAKLERHILGRLADEFDEALLDWKVDVLDLNDIGPEFRRIVDRQKLPLP